MPLYEVSHISPLTGEQKNELAKEITRIHATKFMAPSIFVNVVFNDVRGQDAYVGGELVSRSESSWRLSPPVHHARIVSYPASTNCNIES